MTRVSAGIFSLTAPGPPDADADYFRWHLLDHMPEQYQLPGIQHAQRYYADDELQAGRFDTGPVPPIGSLMTYLVGDPVEQTQADFMALGRHLAEIGRVPHRPASVQLRLLALQHFAAAPSALVSAEVIPWRPHRGIVLLIERATETAAGRWLEWLHTHHHPQVLAADGVAGLWMFGPTRAWKLHPNLDGEAQYTTMVFLDADVASTTMSIRGLLEQRWAAGDAQALFAGPLRTMISWDAWRT